MFLQELLEEAEDIKAQDEYLDDKEILNLQNQLENI